RRLLPVGEHIALLLQPFPLRAGMLQLGGVIAVEHEDHPLIGVEWRRLGAVDKETHIRLIGIAGTGSEQHRLRLRALAGIGAVWEETILPVGPQMRIENVEAILFLGLYDDPPSPF